MAEQRVPVNVYREGRRILVAAPLPGLEPSNIQVDVDGRIVTIHGNVPRPNKTGTQDYIVKEWALGPYYRTIEVPEPVDADLAYASYHNGVLVLIFPVARSEMRGVVPIERVGTVQTAGPGGQEQL